MPAGTAAPGLAGQELFPLVSGTHRGSLPRGRGEVTARRPPCRDFAAADGGEVVRGSAHLSGQGRSRPILRAISARWRAEIVGATTVAPTTSRAPTRGKLHAGPLSLGAQQSLAVLRI